VTVNGLTVIPLLVAFGALILAVLEHRARRRQQAELDRLRALLEAGNGRGTAWRWPPTPQPEAHE